MSKLSNSELILELSQLLNSMLCDEELLKLEIVKTAARRLNYTLLEPYGVWNYCHCVTNIGGVIPFSVLGLMYSLEKLD